MSNLIEISGWAESFAKLCNKVAKEGEYYNVLENGFFTTYKNTGEVILGDTYQETDILGWYQAKAQLENVEKKPNDGDVFIVGLYAPYTRMKAVVRGPEVTWEEDGMEEKKIIRQYKDVQRLGTKTKKPEEGVFYAVGKELPYKVYGAVSAWEPVGHFISSYGLKGRNYGDMAFYDGQFYLHTREGWIPQDFPQSIENYGKHTYVSKDGTKSKIREGFVLGTLEFYSPRS